MQAECATRKSRSQVRGDDDGGDDGGMSGLGGALAGMLGGGGGGGGDDDADDDPNMVGKKKKEKKPGGGIDLAGLEDGLAKGGVGQLTTMLKLMHAAQGSADTHIKKGPNGEDMYDFRDLDDGFTTLPPITMPPQATPPPMPMAVAIPRGPLIALPGKHGKLRGLASAEARERQHAEEEAAAPAAPAHKLVVWPPPPPQAPPTATAITSPVSAPTAPVGAIAAPMSTPVMAPATSQNNLYAGLAAMRQNLDALLGQASGGQIAVGGPAASGNDAALSAKLDQLSSSFAAEETKLEGKVGTLEEENKNMKQQLEEQAKELQEQTKEIKDLSGAKSEGKALIAHSVKMAPKMKAGYATSPWEATFRVHLDGNAEGKEDTFTVRVHPEWAPLGAKRFQDMLRDGLLQDARFFRVVPHFMVQFGIPGSPDVAAKWKDARIPDDPVKKSNYRGTLSFASAGPNSRTTQMFVNFANNDFLDQKGFAPFAEVLGDGMNVVDKIQSKYKEKPNQGKIYHLGNSYLKKHYPKLSFVGHVDSSLNVPALLQESGVPEAPEEKKDAQQTYKYGGIRTFFHRKATKAAN